MDERVVNIIKNSREFGSKKHIVDNDEMFTILEINNLHNGEYCIIKMKSGINQFEAKICIDDLSIHKMLVKLHDDEATWNTSSYGSNERDTGIRDILFGIIESELIKFIDNFDMETEESYMDTEIKLMIESCEIKIEALEQEKENHRKCMDSYRKGVVRLAWRINHKT